MASRLLSALETNASDVKISIGSERSLTFNTPILDACVLAHILLRSKPIEVRKCGSSDDDDTALAARSTPEPAAFPHYLEDHWPRSLRLVSVLHNAWRKSFSDLERCSVSKRRPLWIKTSQCSPSSSFIRHTLHAMGESQRNNSHWRSLSMPISGITRTL